MGSRADGRADGRADSGADVQTGGRAGGRSGLLVGGIVGRGGLEAGWGRLEASDILHISCESNVILPSAIALPHPTRLSAASKDGIGHNAAIGATMQRRWENEVVLRTLTGPKMQVTFVQQALVSMSWMCDVS